MKKILFIVASLVTALSLSAGPVSPEKALQVAGKFFSDQPGTRSGSLSIVWTGNEPSMRRSVAQDPAFYAINRSGGGWIIVAGDDNARPVLGFSTTGKFVAEGMPENVSEWMKGLRLYCRQAAAGASRKEIAVLWDAFDPATRGSMITAEVSGEHTASRTLEWGQGEVDEKNLFNIYCPWDAAASQRSATGCVPLALAEVVTWQSAHGFAVPDKGTGPVGGYTPRSGLYAPEEYLLDTMSTNYQWNLFNDLDYVGIYYADTTVKMAVSRVIADFGAAVKALYSADGTEAVSNDIIVAFGDHFGYSKAAHLEYATVYPPRTWKGMLKSEIDITPVFYAGQSQESGGHAFVMDGYARYLDDDVFHINFGWYGQCNGYYYFQNLDTSYPGDTPENWAYGRAMAIFGFVPDYNAPSHPSEYASPSLTLFNIGTSEGGFLISGTDQIVQGTPFDLELRNLINAGPSDFIGFFTIDLFDKEGNFKEELDSGFIDELNPLLPGVYISSITSRPTITAELAFGDYIAARYRPNGEANFIPVKGSDSGQMLLKYPIYGAAFIDTGSTPTVGDTFDLRLVNAPYVYNGQTYTTTWTITRPDGTQTVIPQDDGVVTLNSAGTWHLKATVTRRTDSSVLETIESDLVVH